MNRLSLLSGLALSATFAFPVPTHIPEDYPLYVLVPVSSSCDACNGYRKQFGFTQIPACGEENRIMIEKWNTFPSDGPCEPDQELCVPGTESECVVDMTWRVFFQSSGKTPGPGMGCVGTVWVFCTIGPYDDQEEIGGTTDNFEFSNVLECYSSNSQAQEPETGFFELLVWNEDPDGYPNQESTPMYSPTAFGQKIGYFKYQGACSKCEVSPPH